MTTLLITLSYFGRLNYYEGVDRLSFTDWLYRYRIGWRTAYRLAKVIQEIKQNQP